MLSVSIGANATGRISGTITDPTAALVSGARVTITSEATGFHTETESAPDGTYQVLDLPIGVYRVSVQQQGFGTVFTGNNRLDINQTVRVDVALKLGRVSEVVSVDSQAAQVETASPTLGGTVSGSPISNLPLNGRNTLDLALTQPGVVPSPPAPSGTVAGTFTVAGGRSRRNSLSDGWRPEQHSRVQRREPQSQPGHDRRVSHPLQHLHRRVRAQRRRRDQRGHEIRNESGSRHSVRILRNDEQNASDYFSNAAGLSRPILKRNQFGGTFGGPVVLPKVFHGKDKMFFYFGYQGQRLSQTVVNSQVTVFTPAELNGDFSRAANGLPDPNVARFRRSPHK